MTLESPVFITSRLLPGVKIGDATISISYAISVGDGRTRYTWYIDGEDNYECDDLQCAPGSTLQDGLETLLSFLGAFADANAFRKVHGINCENIDLFPAELADWAVENVDKFTELQSELQEKESIKE